MSCYLIEELLPLYIEGTQVQKQIKLLQSTYNPARAANTFITK